MDVVLSMDMFIAPKSVPLGQMLSSQQIFFPHKCEQMKADGLFPDVHKEFKFFIVTSVITYFIDWAPYNLPYHMISESPFLCWL